MVTKIQKNNVVLACHITGVYDVNRNTTLPDDEFGIVQEWTEALEQVGVKGVLFHNNLSAETCLAHSSQYVQFQKIEYDPAFKPNVYRYLVYQDFLQKYNSQIDGLFLTDSSDVVVLNNPFVQPLFTQYPDHLFCGDEPEKLDNDWMRAHSENLRHQISDYADYEEKFKYEMLLNCGIIGGHVSVMKSLLDQLCAIHKTYNQNNQTAYTGDMGAFNYIARTRFNNRLFHGFPINTVFKAYQNERTDCWFRHK